MTEKDSLLTRCMIAKVINIPPDDIDVIKLVKEELFLVPYDNKWEFGISFDSVPTESDILLVIDNFKDVGEEWLDEEDLL